MRDMTTPRKAKLAKYLEKGYRIRVGVIYNSRSNMTIINEYIYNPQEENENDREIDHWYINFYPGQPDDEKTREYYRRMKVSICRESMDDVEFEHYMSPAEKCSAMPIYDEVPEPPEEAEQILKEIRRKREEESKALSIEEIINKYRYGNSPLFRFESDYKETYPELPEDEEYDYSEIPDPDV